MANMFDNHMNRALEQARLAADLGEVPVGAAIIHNQRVIAVAHNTVINKCDPTGHAEINALKQAAIALGTPNLSDCDLYVTLEPCAMCAGAISWARIRNLYFGAFDEKSGAIEHGARIFSQSTCHHRPTVYGGIMADECGGLVSHFFQGLRQKL
ncbi:MAG: nucleoside deaminase [Proteobacteria bacterium]|nr:nucleoside deaminase [Pseudomonadota bacterium]